MKTYENIIKQLNSQDMTEKLCALYSCTPEEAEKYRSRIARIAQRYDESFPDAPAANIYSAPGRTEIGGNHTDHQHGCVLAAAVNMDAVAAAAANGTDTIVIQSEGYAPFTVELGSLEPDAAEKDSPVAMVRGVAARAAQLGYKPEGFTAYITSDVPGGSGLSSSACFEVLVGTIINDLFCGGELDSIAIARAGQFAENNYAMKPSGLLDQATSSVGGLVSMDFSLDEPVLDSIRFDFGEHGYVLCVINTGGSHASLTDEYASITEDMRAVSEHFGKTLLHDVNRDDFLHEIPALRQSVGERAVLRAMHFFDETQRALDQAQALRDGDVDCFLALVNESGRSSEMCLQNIFPVSSPKDQGVTLGLAVARRLLGGKGAYRVHGGGFAGTIQAYVPAAEYTGFVSGMEQVFGAGCCYLLAVRPAGGVRII